MECCQCEGIETRFNQEYVAKKLQRYREKGPKESTRILIEVLTETLDNDMTLLDIGSGIGDIQHALLGEGVKESFNCEASSAFIDACKQEAERQGNANRITHINGVDPVTWTPLCLVKGVHNAENTSSISRRVSKENG